MLDVACRNQHRVPRMDTAVAYCFSYLSLSVTCGRDPQNERLLLSLMWSSMKRIMMMTPAKLASRRGLSAGQMFCQVASEIRRTDLYYTWYKFRWSRSHLPRFLIKQNCLPCCTYPVCPPDIKVGSSRGEGDILCAHAQQRDSRPRLIDAEEDRL